MAGKADKKRWIYLAIVFSVLLGACTSLTPVQGPAHNVSIPADFPEAYYQQAAAHGKKVLRVDSARSLLVIEVRRGGTMARLGHDHVVASHNVKGYVAFDEGRSDLYVPLEDLVVDELDLRTEAGFDTQPSREAIEGTRNNMLGKVLETGRYPFSLIHIVRTKTDQSTLSISITLHGTTRTFDIPAKIETLPDGIIASGQMAFNQTDFGIVPFSVLGGAMQVQDRLALRFRIFAN
jgi:hypothetical protein